MPRLRVAQALTLLASPDRDCQSSSPLTWNSLLCAVRGLALASSVLPTVCFVRLSQRLHKVILGSTQKGIFYFYSHLTCIRKMLIFLFMMDM